MVVRASGLPVVFSSSLPVVFRASSLPVVGG